MTQFAHQEARGHLTSATLQLRHRLACVSLLFVSFAGCAASPTPPDTTAVYADDPAAGASPLAVQRWSVNEPDATTVGAPDPSSQPPKPASTAEAASHGTTLTDAAPAETAPKRTGVDGPGAEQAHAEQADAEQADAEQPDAEQPGAEQPDAEQPDAGESGADQADAARSTPSQR